eukprot:CAMPEP_0182894148 /NCGR_PEP_ID=MMETSP0034_2-20130328/24899_1 /TAXON_ID=156128 /ORGANISM="Nephroselmis pyriformis, Strain CCMP717" /LENGTH=81 /DNA_ID=CAMNT_0025027919 /DNA_START=113 /DNA_END=355 /DNA_ORIENTATION=+
MTKGEGSSDRRVVLVMTVDIGAGRSGRIEVRDGDSAATCAAKFVDANGLHARFVGPLTTHIQSNLDRIATQPSRSSDAGSV